MGGLGQYDDAMGDPNKFYLPLARSDCRIALSFHKKKIVSVEEGPAFDPAEWRQMKQAITKSLFDGELRVGRDYSFSGFRVSGSWRGRRSGVQILPPPDDAPSAPYKMADHPFILEFPVNASDFWPLTNYRRRREHRELTLLLNVLLTGHVNFQPHRAQHFWAAIDPLAGNDPEIRWVKQFYFAPLGEVVIEELSPPSGGLLDEIEPDEYVAKIGHDGKDLRVPSDLDDLICRYQQLSDTNRSKFNRATFWMDQSVRVWTISLSSSFAALVTAVEALTDREPIPRATQIFHNFFETFAQGRSLKKRRKKMYELRSDILHGSDLMQLDQDRDFGHDPPGQNERGLSDELRGLTRLAMRNWLLNPPS
jgi:hypothetical protein